MALMSSRLVAQEQYSSAPERIPMTVLCKLRVRLETVQINLVVLMLCVNDPEGPFFSDLEGRRGRSLNRD
jgi:hypothetical protein